MLGNLSRARQLALLELPLKLIDPIKFQTRKGFVKVRLLNLGSCELTRILTNLETNGIIEVKSKAL